MTQRVEAELVANVIKVLVAPGDTVAVGDMVVLLESTEAAGAAGCSDRMSAPQPTPGGSMTQRVEAELVANVIKVLVAPGDRWPSATWSCCWSR